MESLTTPGRLKTILHSLLVAAMLIADPSLGADPPQAKPASRPESKPGETLKPVTPPSKTLILFNGKNLEGWQKTPFGGEGEVSVETNTIVVGMGATLSGVTFTNATLLPTNRYEISLEAMRVEGNDFFCGLTFQVHTSACSLILGGWGGAVVGLSSIDDMDASENESTQFMGFTKKQWYKVRVEVLPEKISAWIDDKKVIEQEIKGRKISLRAGGIESSLPLGLSTFQTTAAYRNIQLRRLD